MTTRFPLGVNVVGYLDSVSGTGEIARLLLASLRRAGIPYTVILNRLSLSSERSTYIASPSTELYDINIICANADELPRIAGRLGRLLDGRYTIGVWAWEVDQFPPNLAANQIHLQEVWAISSFCAAAIRSAIKRPVHVFSLPVQVPMDGKAVNRKTLGLPTGFTFLYCFDYLSVFERKNPLALVTAFRKAFPGELSGAVLVIKSINSALDLAHHRELLSAVTGRSDIIVLDRYLDSADQSSLIAACDAYVSLHRSEGFGLTLAEAMLRAKPVVATGYSGNLDFMDASNSWLIPYDLVPVPAGCDPYPAGAHWADPSVEAAAAAMLDVFANPSKRLSRAKRGRVSIERSHSPDARVPFLKERLSAATSALQGQREQGGTRLRRLLAEIAPDWVVRTRVRRMENRLRPGYSGNRVRLSRPYRTVRAVIARMARRRIGFGASREP